MDIKMKPLEGGTYPFFLIAGCEDRAKAIEEKSIILTQAQSELILNKPNRKDPAREFISIMAVIVFIMNISLVLILASMAE